MIFLLPPSETKEPGGQKSAKVLSFPELTPTRKLLEQALVELCSSPSLAAKALKLGPKQQGEIAVNLELTKPKCLPAIDRYTGTLYDALKLGGLTAGMRNRAKRSLYIQSSLFGLISAMDEIPNYRLSAGSKIPGKKSLNHFNKQAKGQFLRAVLLSKPEAKTIAELKVIAKQVDLKLEVTGRKLLLITHG